MWVEMHFRIVVVDPTSVAESKIKLQGLRGKKPLRLYEFDFGGLRDYSGSVRAERRNRLAQGFSVNLRCTRLVFTNPERLPVNLGESFPVICRLFLNRYPSTHAHDSGPGVLSRTRPAQVVDEFEAGILIPRNGQSLVRALRGKCAVKAVSFGCINQSFRCGFHAGNLPGGFNHHNGFGMIYSWMSSNNNGWLRLTVISIPSNIFIISSSGSRSTCGLSVE